MNATKPKKVRVPDLVTMKQRGERIVMLTAYDATMAGLLERRRGSTSGGRLAR
jgi:ketopantoate hydroxymethyltransferase